MCEPLNLEDLRDAVCGRAAAFRCRATLQPAGGEGAKVFPPTYSGAVYATEKRRLPGHPEPVECVLLDSVQSQANRMEEAVQQAVDEGRLKIPVIEVDFTPYFPGDDQDEDMRLLDPVGKISSLQAPHRIADAILRDSVVAEENKPFRAQKAKDESTIGQKLRLASIQNATPVFEHCPTALVFGMWDSTGPKGGLGAKFERAIVSEIVGIDAPDTHREARNRGLRTDPLGIRREVAVVGNRMAWSLASSPKQKGALRPSEIVHGNVPFESENAGVTISHAEQITVLSLPALRRWRFPLPGAPWEASDEQRRRDQAARTVLAALGLCAAALAAERGLDLRSRCLLWPTEPLTWELLGRPGEEPLRKSLEAESAIFLLEQAVKQAMDLGLPWRTEPLVLTPSEPLLKLVAKSQRLAVEQGADSGEGAE